MAGHNSAYHYVLRRDRSWRQGVSSNYGVYSAANEVDIFADDRMEDAEWAALFSALRRSLTRSMDGPPLAEDAVLIRGEALARRLPLQDGIAVYLEGNCALLPPPLYARYFVKGVLDWVPLANGRIQPFVHVNCTLLVEMLEWPGMHWSHNPKK
jgi:hypothetical protein